MSKVQQFWNVFVDWEAFAVLGKAVNLLAEMTLYHFSI